MQGDRKIVGEKIKHFLVGLWSARKRIWGSRKQILQYLLIVVLSTFVWFLIKLNHEYTIEISREVVLKETPFWLHIVPSDVHRVSYRVKGLGFGLLSHRGFLSASPLYLNYMDSLRLFSSISPSGASIRREDLASILARLLPTELQLVSVQTDSVYYRFDWQGSRRVPVRFSARYRLADQCLLLESPRLSVDSVEVIGTENCVSQVSQLSTSPLDLGVLSPGRHVRRLPLELPVGVAASQREVSVIFSVEKYTEKRLNVPVRVGNMGDSLRLQLLPASVEVVCQVPVSCFDSLTPSSLPFYVLPDTTQQLPRLRVELDSIPNYIHRLSFSPMYVGYYVSKP